MTNYYSHLGLTYNQRTAYKHSILERDNHICQLCGQPGDIVDHIIPFAISHDSTESNLRALCRKCNLDTRRPRKDTNQFHTLDEWQRYIESELMASVDTPTQRGGR